MAKVVNPEQNTASLKAKGELMYKETARLILFAIPWPFRHYELYENDLVIIRGLLNIHEDDCYMYKVQDVKLTRTLGEKMVGVGTITCFTGDSTDPMLVIKHVKKSKEIKEFILHASEEARLKRRTVNMLDIGSGDMSDLDHFN